MLANARTLQTRSIRGLARPMMSTVAGSYDGAIQGTGQQSDPNDQKHVQQKESKESERWYGATILSVEKMTPTVTGLSLLVETENANDLVDGAFRRVPRRTTRFTFCPGQWVDFYIPRLHKIGGYSLTSLPSELPRIDLAVKASCHPPAQWVTENASVGDEVKVRVGGDFIYDRTHVGQRVGEKPGGIEVPPNHTTGDINESSSYNIFIAGGVGINPLYGMIRQIHEDLTNNGTCSSQAALLYSVSTKEDLLFDAELSEMVSEFPLNLWMHYTVTKCSTVLNQGSDDTTGRSSRVFCERIDTQSIATALDWLGCEREDAKVYICGPAGMAEEMSELCCGLGIPESSIRFEQWW